MYEVVSKQVIGDELRRIEIVAPAICTKAQPGQFVMVAPDEKSARVALMIAGVNALKQTITLIFKEDSLSMKRLGSLWIGDSVFALLGPLGKPSEIKEFGNVLCIGYETGAVSLLTICRALHKAENKVISVLGAKTKRDLCLQPQIHLCSQKSYVMSEDGSVGERGYITDGLEKIFVEQEIDRIYVAGPLAVIQEVLSSVRDKGILTKVLINPMTIDGFGICGCDLIKVKDRYVSISIEGPEFDADEIDFAFFETKMKNFKA
ncbi:MAG: hypothetical protein PHY73_03710 [Candidatus Omnitrophica bacterium]|nr:hypothetical protein [Candidatus Omnitrophota bacterium]